MHDRETNYDLLRVISSIAVVLIHVGNSFLDASFEYNIETFGFVFRGNLLITFILDSLPRFAVPCFVMLSGAFILDNKKNKDSKHFYKRSFSSIGITTIVFSVIYTLYSCVKGIINDNRGFFGGIIYPIINAFLGRPFYHMWYLYMLIGLYLVTPVLLSIEENYSKTILCGKIPWILLAVASISYWVQPSSFKLGWDISLQVEFLTFFLVGYSIRCWAKKRNKSNILGIILIALGLLMEILLAYLRYKKVQNGCLLSNERIEFSFLGYEGLAPFVVISSVLIFMGFSVLNIKLNLSKLSSYMFLIYLIHAGIWDVMKFCIRHGIIHLPQAEFTIIACTLLIFVLSLLVSILYKKVWNKIDSKLKVTDRLCKLFRLE